MQVNPADIRFTQDSISLYFQNPYDHFSVREAVRKISRNKMTPDDFPLIRVNSYGGCLWSVDNRRLWVFRLARCPSIAVKLVKKIHPRLKEVLSNSDLHSMMQVEDFFPRVRDRGLMDRVFDRRFPPPVASLQWPVIEALEKPPINMAQVSSVDTEKSGTSTMPQKASINYAQENAKDDHQHGHTHIDTIEETGTPPPEPSINRVQENAKDDHQHDDIHIDIIEESGTTRPPKPSVDPVGDHAKDEHQSETVHVWNAFAIARKIANAERMTRDVVGNFFWNIISVGRKIAATVARRIASFGRTTKNAVGSFFWNIFSFARKTAAAVARKIAA